MSITNISGVSKTPSAQLWKKIGPRKRSGVLAPLFSIYSRNSIGVGDMSDLKVLADLCCKAGDTLVQLLPMNEVGSEFCPYDAISSFAIEPLYISLDSIKINDADIIKAIEALKKKFPAGKGHVDYGIKDAKLGILRQVFKKDSSGLKSPEFKDFIKDNSYWLDDLALFKVLKAEHDGKPWYEWEEGYQLRDGDALDIVRRVGAAPAAQRPGDRAGRGRGAPRLAQRVLRAPGRRQRLPLRRGPAAAGHGSPLG
ncbi:MAG TPA: 4-alpha-glucanotransferase, partial [Candidatus Omnitrophota bacterium]|nr:4-alpha-glucanotransferase [Candidatus Omnitrophota bacterium]